MSNQADQIQKYRETFTATLLSQAYHPSVPKEIALAQQIMEEQTGPEKLPGLEGVELAKARNHAFEMIVVDILSWHDFRIPLLLAKRAAESIMPGPEAGTMSLADFEADLNRRRDLKIQKEIAEAPERARRKRETSEMMRRMFQRARQVAPPQGEAQVASGAATERSKEKEKIPSNLFQAFISLFWKNRKSRYAILVILIIIALAALFRSAWLLVPEKSREFIFCNYLPPLCPKPEKQEFPK